MSSEEKRDLLWKTVEEIKALRSELGALRADRRDQVQAWIDFVDALQSAAEMDPLPLPQTLATLDKERLARNFTAMREITLRLAKAEQTQKELTE